MFGFVPIPLSVEVIVVWLNALSLLCEVTVVLALCLASCVEVIAVLA